MSFTDVTELSELFSETLARVRARLDADANATLAEDDPEWIDTRQGSFYWDVTQPPAMEMARLWDAMTEAVAAAFPSTAWGEYLDEHGRTFNLVRNPAIAATGYLTFITSEATAISAGVQVSTAVPELGDAITFQTVESGTSGAPLGVPGVVNVNVLESGGLLSAGTRYYQVTAVNEFGETEASEPVEATTVGNTGRNVLSWGSVLGAQSYRVYSSPDAEVPGGLVGSTVSAGFIDDGATTPTDTTPPERNMTSGVTLAAQATEAGAASSVAAGAVTSMDSAIATVLTVTNLEPMTGGADEESDEDFRVRIIGQYVGTSGGGNVADYRRWAAQQGVNRVTVVPVWNGPGTVLVIAMQPDGSPVAQGVVDGLQAFLDPVPGKGAGQAPIGATVTVKTSTQVQIEVAAEVVPVDGYSLDGAEATVATRGSIMLSLIAYLQHLQPGDTIVYEHVQSCFFVPGVFRVNGLTVEGGTQDIPLGTGITPEVATLNPASVLTEP